MTSYSVAESVRSYLEQDIGEFGRPCGIKPWVVADVHRYFAEQPPLDGMVFLLRAQGCDNETTSRILQQPKSVVVHVVDRLRFMASLLQAGVCA